MKKKFKAFSAPPFVLKAVMAGQVGENLTFWYYNFWGTGGSERLVCRHESIPFISTLEDLCLRCE